MKLLRIPSGTEAYVIADGSPELEEVTLKKETIFEVGEIVIDPVGTVGYHRNHAEQNFFVTLAKLNFYGFTLKGNTTRNGKKYNTLIVESADVKVI